MYCVSIVSVKGGVGKSTACANLAAAAHTANPAARTLLIDTDIQQSTVKWAEQRRQLIPRVISADARTLSREVDNARGAFDICFIDGAGHDWKGLAAAVLAADLALVVARPTLIDYHVARQVRSILSDYRVGFAFLLTQAPPGNRLTQWLAEYRKLGNVAPVVSARVAFQDSFGFGKGVTEYEPHGSAAREINCRSWL
ncbi:chromosome partitioning protein [Nitrobacteraceae bacterium AZCC 2146]